MIYGSRAMEKRSIGVIGTGAMASAIMNGMINAGAITAEELNVYDVNEEKMNALRQKGFCCCNDARDVVRKSDVILLAVKPQNFEALFSTLDDCFDSKKLVVSIAAGVPIKKIRDLSRMNDLSVVRVMPNAPMLMLEGASVIATCPPTTDEELAFVENMFRCCGTTQIVSESQINATIAIHSSSPAYIFLFAKAVAEYATANGIDEKMALSLFSQALVGSARMIEKTGLSCDQLIAMITSPNGTTEASLKSFAKNDFYGTLLDGLKACKDRADELGK